MGFKRSLVPALMVLCAACASAQTACKLTRLEIPVRIVDRRPVATLTLNGTEVPLLVDSGAFFSVLSHATAAQLKLPLRELPWGMRIEGYTGTIEAQRTVVSKVGLLRSELRNVEFIVGGNELGAGIMGVLGRNFLSIGDTEYDLAHGAVRLFFPKGDCDNTDMAYWAGEAPVVKVPLLDGSARNDDPVLVNLEINGKESRALMDTGAPHTALSARLARRADIKPETMIPAGRAGGAGEGKVQSWLARVDRFAIGGEVITNSLLRVDDTSRADHSALVGLDYFLSHRIYVSRLQRQVYITWNGNPIFPPASGKEGTYDTRYAALPEQLPEGDADALARRGAAALALHNLPAALGDLDRAIELAPQVAPYRFTRARVRVEQRQIEPALADLSAALELDPSHAEARLLRASLLAGLGRAADAMADLAQLDATLPPTAHQRAHMANLHVRLGQVPEALRQYGHWISTHPNDARLADMLNNRCWLRARNNLEIAQALRDCKQAVDLDSKDANHLDSLGWTYLRLAEPAQARRAFDSALKIKPLAFSLLGRSLALRQLGDADGSAADLAQAVRLEPGVGERARQAGFGTLEGLPELLGKPGP